MSEYYTVDKISTEIFTATCNDCKRFFSSQVESKAVHKVKEHLRDKHGKK